MRILAVDDNPVDRTLLAEMLRKAMAPEDELTLAESGEQALEAITTQPFDLIFTDLLMPNISGIDLLVRAKQQQPTIEVLVITVSQSVEAAVAAMKKGARDYLTKPLNAAIIREKLNYMRDYITRAREAEEHRLAQEVIENAAADAVRALETCSERLDAVVTAIQEILAREASDTAKVNAIAEIIQNYRRQKTS